MITIQPFQPHQQKAAKDVLLTVCQELWEVPADVVVQYDPLTDLDDIQSYYLDNNGLFLVLVDDGRVVGTGGMRHWQDRICELKRLWFLKEYRGHGFGWQMAQQILEFAIAKGYERMRLDVADVHLLEAASHRRSLHQRRLDAPDGDHTGTLGGCVHLRPARR